MHPTNARAQRRGCRRDDLRHGGADPRANRAKGPARRYRYGAKPPRNHRSQCGLSARNPAGSSAPRRPCHREIAFVTGPPHLESARSRKSAFVAAVKVCGLTPRPHWIIEGNHTMEGGIAAMGILLERKRKVPR